MAMLRLASSKVVPHALRAISSPRISRSITNAFTDSQESPFRESLFIISHDFSTGDKKQIDRKVAKILKSEIKFKQLFLEKSMPPIPADFPFTIQDDPCERNITLTREFDGEKIEVVVVMPSNIPEYDEEESDSTDSTDDDSNDDNGSGSDGGDDESKDNGSGNAGGDDDRNDSGSVDGAGDDYGSSTDSNYSDEDEEDESPSLSLRTTIAKENGKKLVFNVSASADDIQIESMLFKEPAAESSNPLLSFGPHSVEEEGDLQRALREFLEIRGIKKPNFEFLYEYMVRKAKQRPMLALKKLRKFIKE